MNDPGAATYSISVRLQRVTTESAHISVPVTEDIMIRQPDGTGRIDGAKMVQRAIELGRSPGVAWQVEGQQVQPHRSRRRYPGSRRRGETANMALQRTPLRGAAELGR